MTDPDGRSLAATLLSSMAHAAVVVEAADRVLAWNVAAEAELAVTPAALGRTLAELGLAGLPGAFRLPLLEDASSGAVAIVAWSDTLPDAEIGLQRLRALARLAPGVTHEGNNHLSGFAAFFGMLRLDDAFVADYGANLIRDLEVSARRAPELLGAFAELARDRLPRPAPQALASNVAMALLLTEYAMDVKRVVAVTSDLPEVLADGSRLHQALVAILLNALDALGGAKARGHLAVAASVIEGDGASGVRLVIEDDAAPVPERDRPHLFDRIPPAGTSARSGLDLAVARRLLEMDGGTLEYEAGPDGRNRFVAILRIPEDRPPRTGVQRDPIVPAVPAPAPAPGVVAGQLTVLVCDDEEQVRDLMARILERSRHRVLLAASGDGALAILDTENVDIVMSDHNMSVMTGVELYTTACERHPHLRRRFVLMSGDPGAPDVQAFSSRTGLPVLGKPFSVTALEDAIQALARR